MQAGSGDGRQHETLGRLEHDSASSTRPWVDSASVGCENDVQCRAFLDLEREDPGVTAVCR
ncbi:MAG: hypothetical protein OEY14_02920 [Myxococcales bacterium]|nr:hypothetical protein [Myxococcales bacterium]